ncbi:MAG: GerMN domain-containing protein [Bacilli bacterium]|nr:GerMN domain-containing protein [Bacilli bacterium]
MKNLLLRKVFTITLTVFIILSVFTIPTIKEHNVLRTNYEIETITSLKTTNIYLLNEDNLLVEVKVINEEKELHKQIDNIINYLTVNNKHIPKGLKGYLSKDTKVLNSSLDNDILYLDINYLDNKNIPGIVYSLLSLKRFSKVKITVNGKELKEYPNPIDKSIGINNEYLFNSRNNINRVVIYYLDNINNNEYYIPVTKYLNDDRDRIKIIIDQLKNNDNLISLVNKNLELIDYREENNILFLNFNNKINKDIIDEIAYSCFDNYDINMVMFEFNGKRQGYRIR